MPMAPGRNALDVSIVAGGILYLATILVFRFIFGAELDPTSGDVSAFGAEFARLNRLARSTDASRSWQ